MASKNNIEQIFKIFHSFNPKPSTELIYKNDFTCLVAVVLSARTTDLSVNRATQSLFATYDTPARMLSLGEEGLRRHIQSIGLFNSKAKHIIALSRILVQHYHGDIPNTFEALTALPGVGRKTANVLLNSLFNQPTLAVDTHVFRVAHRVGLAIGKTAEKVEAELLQKIPRRWLLYAHHWLVLHGRYICKARQPACHSCPIQTYCKYDQEKRLSAT